jgi:hypothetical protein
MRRPQLGNNAQHKYSAFVGHRGEERHPNLHRTWFENEKYFSRNRGPFRAIACQQSGLRKSVFRAAAGHATVADAGTLTQRLNWPQQYNLSHRAPPRSHVFSQAW